MKTNYLTLIVLSILFSCSKEKSSPTNEDSFNDPNWIKLEIPDNREAHAIYGSIEDTLLVSTIYNTYQITDKGKTLTKLNKEFHQPVYAFVKSNDTLYALMSNHLKDNDGLKFASYAQYFSLDKGITWQWTDLYKNKIDLKKKFQEVIINDHLSIKLKENIEFYPNSTTSGLILKSDLVINRNGLSTVFNLPFNNQITSLHSDKYGYLYISASAGLYDPLTKKYSGEEKGNKAIIYVSKKKGKDLIAN